MLRIRHKEGIEEYPSVRSVYNVATRDSGESEFIIRADFGPASRSIKRFQDLFHPKPWLEIVVPSRYFSGKLESGNTILMPEGYDYVNGENITNFLYASHESVEKISIKILEFSEERSVLLISGLTGAAHGAADTKIEVNAVFTRDNTLKRSFS